MPLKGIADPSARPWRSMLTEPFDVIQREDITVVTCMEGLLILDTQTGAQKKLIRNPQFRRLHKAAFNPTNRNLILVASSRADRILEVNIETGEVVYQWVAWTNGFSKNHFGMTLVDKQNPISAEPSRETLTREEYIKRFEGKDEATLLRTTDKYRNRRCIVAIPDGFRVSIYLSASKLDWVQR